MTTDLPTRRLDPVTVALTLLLALIACFPIPAAAASTGSRDPVGEWPLQPVPEVVGDFDPPDSPYGAGHRGVDLAGSVGQPVRAALAGTVTFAGSLAGRGVVVIDHGPTRTTYEPVSPSVSVGTQVGAEDRIGDLQLSGSHCFPHACLHWGWIEGDTYLDPLRLVGGGSVRLLPLWRDDPVNAAARPAPVALLPYDTWQPLLRLLAAATTLGPGTFSPTDQARGCACW